MSDGREIPILSIQDFIKSLYQSSAGQRRLYSAMYSSWLGGIVQDVPLMLVPIDDHLVHRGDGVFEAFRLVEGAFYDLPSHLARLERSAAAIALDLPNSLSEIAEICRATARSARLREGLVRLFVSRGPGGFTTNPYESVASQLYIVVTPFVRPDREKYEKGARARQSEIAVKEVPFCQIKSCNYLPNVLMKKEAVDWKVDFTLSVESGGSLAEGSTENFFIVNAQRELVAPLFNYTLRGTTLMRCLQLAEKLVVEGELSGIRQDRVTVEDLLMAREAHLVGTTIEVMPLVEFNGQPIGGGRPGPMGRRLRDLLVADMTLNSQLRLEVDS